MFGQIRIDASNLGPQQLAQLATSFFAVVVWAVTQVPYWWVEADLRSCLESQGYH